MKPEILRNIFLVVFIASSAVLSLLILGPFAGNVFSTINSSQISSTEQPGIVATPEPGGDDPSSVPSTTNRDSGALFGTILTSVTSLVGFATTTVITWRKEKRESSLADMERKKLETELEKSRLELEELKKKSGKKERSKK